MRVLQVMAGGRHGGAEAFFVRLTAALAEAGVETRAVLRPDADRGAILEKAQVPVVELPFGGWFDLKTGPGLKRVIRDFAPDVVLSWMNRATRFVPRAVDGAPPFVRVGRLGGYYKLKYYRHCDWLVGNTQGIVDYLTASGWPADRVRYIPNFADEVLASPAPRAQFHTPDDVPLFLAMGRLHPAKGFDVLLEALAQVPRAWLWLAGEGELRGALEAQAASLGIAERVQFLGWRNDGPALAAAADALVCSSRHEPLGNVVIEAWVRGLPVIAARAQGPSALIDDGRTGLLVPCDDAAALADAMTRLASDKMLAASLATGGREAYRRQFSQAAVVGRYIEFFREITASRTVTAPVAKG